MKLILDEAPKELIEYIHDHLPESLEDVEIVSLDGIEYNDSALGRWTQLVLAGEGARLWSNTANKNSPLHAGALPSTGKGADLVIADLVYTKQQLDFFKGFGVVYIGRVEVDPRNLLIIDHKKASLRHDVHLSEPLSAFLSALPADWWGSLGVVSAGSVDKLQAFLEAMPDTVPLVYSTGAAAKLRFFGLDFVDLVEPKYLEGTKPDMKYGRDVRGRTNSLFLQPKK
jgi:hypothetical protein